MTLLHRLQLMVNPWLHLVDSLLQSASGYRQHRGKAYLADCYYMNPSSASAAETAAGVVGRSAVWADSGFVELVVPIAEVEAAA